MTCRAKWYDLGCPSPKKCIEQNLMPEDETGKRVNIHALRHWMVDYQWYMWKDEMDAQLSIKIEDEVLARKVMLVKEQLDQVRVVRQTAFEEVTKGFDSSSAAVSSFFKSLQEERTLMQIEKVIEDLSKAQTADLQKEFRELAERAGATDGVIEEEQEGNAESID